MIRSLRSSSVLDIYSRIYIVCNMSSTSTTLGSGPARAAAARAERIEAIAETLPSRAAILVRLLVKQMRGREISRTEMEVLSILVEGPRRITELADLAGTAQPTM